MAVTPPTASPTAQTDMLMAILATEVTTRVTSELDGGPDILSQQLLITFLGPSTPSKPHAPK